MGKYLVFISMGFEIVGLIVGSFFLGNLIDTKYQTKGLAFVFLSLACLIGWLVRVIWLVNKLQAQEDKEDQKNENNR